MKFTVISTDNNIMFTDWIKNIRKSSNKLNFNTFFNIISTPNESSSVQYFSYVEKDLFHQVVLQYVKKSIKSKKIYCQLRFNKEI